MRLHHLEVTAFGPFAERVVVDFDALSDAGLFLLTGATGAGKTSVLDAVCFALYGDVPGDRSSAKRLRSDQAAAGVDPEVTLEATLAGRRFRIARSPAWERPKKRGTGTTTQQASVSALRAASTATWQPLSTRLDEAGHLITRPRRASTSTSSARSRCSPRAGSRRSCGPGPRSGTSCSSSCSAPAASRTSSAGCATTGITLRRASEAHEATVADLVSRLSEAAAPTPVAADPPFLDELADGAPLELWAGALVESAATERDRAVRELEVATSAAAIAESAREAGQLLADRRPATRPPAASCPGWTGRRSATSAPSTSWPRRRGRREPSAGARGRGQPGRPRSRRGPRRPAAGADLAGLGGSGRTSTPTPSGRPATSGDRSREARPCCPRSACVGLRHQVETYAGRIAQLDGELVAAQDDPGPARPSSWSGVALIAGSHVSGQRPCRASSCRRGPA